MPPKKPCGQPSSPILLSIAAMDLSLPYDLTGLVHTALATTQRPVCWRSGRCVMGVGVGVLGVHWCPIRSGGPGVLDGKFGAFGSCRGVSPVPPFLQSRNWGVQILGKRKHGQSSSPYLTTSAPQGIRRKCNGNRDNPASDHDLL